MQFKHLNNDVQKEIIEFLKQDDFISAKKLYHDQTRKHEEIPESFN